MHPKKTSKQGFTLTEVLTATTLSAIVMGSVLGLYLNYLRGADSSMAWQLADNKASLAIERMVTGSNDTIGIREFSKTQTSCVWKGESWVLQDRFRDESYSYSSNEGTIKDDDGNVIAENVTDAYASFSGDAITISIKVSNPSRNGKCSSMYWTCVQLRNG